MAINDGDNVDNSNTDTDTYADIGTNDDGDSDVDVGDSVGSSTDAGDGAGTTASRIVGGVDVVAARFGYSRWIKRGNTREKKKFKQPTTATASL